MSASAIESGLHRQREYNRNCLRQPDLTMTVRSASGCDQHPPRDGAGTNGGLGMSGKIGACCRGGGGGGESGGVGGSSSSGWLLLELMRPIGGGGGGGARGTGGNEAARGAGEGGGRGLAGGSQIFCREERGRAQ